MIPINRTFAPIGALVDELARCGMTHAVTCPGSRNAPIALTLAGHDRIEAVSVIDERAGGFVALGMAKATGRPVAITCTSGTAAANLLPAVVEAREARVPLIVLTADRPPELRDVGAGQAIDQIKLYGSAAKWFVEVGNGEPGRAWATHIRALACRAYATAAAGLPGPVHLNLPLREPLAPVPEDLDPADWEGRESGGPWVAVRSGAPQPPSGAMRALETFAGDAPRGVIVCGEGSAPAAEEIVRAAATAGWPVLADPLSGLRCGPLDRAGIVAGYDLLLRSERFAQAAVPDLVVRVGDSPTSKALRAWLAGAPQVVVDPHGAWHEPSRAAELILQADPTAVMKELADALEQREPPVDAGWRELWRSADEAAAGALAQAPDPFEPAVYAALEPVLGAGSAVWVSSSMPIRDVEAWFPAGPKELRFLANRGANGIDGVVSSAAGAALALGRPVTLLIGDVALLHDIGGLLAAARARAPLTIVCVDNGGGAIFDGLPVARHADAAAYERHVATSGRIDLSVVAGLAGLDYRPAATHAEAAAAVAAGPSLVHVVTDREAALAARREVTAAAVAAVDASLS